MQLSLDLVCPWHLWILTALGPSCCLLFAWTSFSPWHFFLAASSSDDATFSRSDLRLQSLDLGSSSSEQLWSLRPDTLFFPDKPFPLFSSIPYFLHSAFLFLSLLTEAFTHRRFYTHKLIHIKAFTHTEAFLIHRSFCTQSTFYTENLSHRNCSSKTETKKEQIWSTF